MGHVAYSSKNRLFEPVSGHFTPIRPTNPRRERHGLPTLATVLPPTAPRPTSEVRLGANPPPLATRLPPTAEFPINSPARSGGRGSLVRCSSGRRWQNFPFPAS